MVEAVQIPPDLNFAVFIENSIRQGLPEAVADELFAELEGLPNEQDKGVTWLRKVADLMQKEKAKA